MTVVLRRQTRLGSVEFFGIPPKTAGIPEQFGHDDQRIILDPPGVVRDTVVLAIRAKLASGEGSGEVEGVWWEKELDATAPGYLGQP